VLLSLRLSLLGSGHLDARRGELALHGGELDRADLAGAGGGIRCGVRVLRVAELGRVRLECGQRLLTLRDEQSGCGQGWSNGIRK
jgi:hypothetical protein